MSSTDSGHRSLRRGNPVLQAAVISGACAIVAALIGGLFTLASEWLSGSPISRPTIASPSPQPRQSISIGSPSPQPFIIGPGIRIDPDVPLNHSTFCSWQFGRYPMPLAAVPQPGTRPLVHIDARCVYPEDPDP
jgi:hypothetical protein